MILLCTVLGDSILQPRALGSHGLWGTPAFAVEVVPRMSNVESVKPQLHQ